MFRDLTSKIKRLFAPRGSTYLDYGDFRGTYASGIDSFKGIPYATPPIAALRFQNPRPVTGNFSNFDATRLGPACPQQNLFAGAVGPSPMRDAIIKVMIESSTPDLTRQGTGQEDCLTLDIHRPSNISKYGGGLPVMLYIHGGAFILGSSAMLPGQNLVAKSISLKMPVIYVAMNYRLGLLGFLGGREVGKAGVANLGLKDQRLAMQWVQKHIARFGGDPRKVMVFGHSAGAMSISYHLYAFGGNLKGLFRAAILQSGTALPATTASDHARQQRFDTMARHVGCLNVTDPLSCLRSVKFERLLALENMFPGPLALETIPLPFTPLVDGGILPDILTQKKFALVPIISGQVEDEGTLLVAGPASSISTLKQLQSFLHSVYIRMTSGLLNTLLNYYHKSLSSSSVSQQIAVWITDTVFQSPRRAFLRAAQHLTPAWGYMDVGAKETPFLGAWHGSDVRSVFSFPTSDPDRTKEFQTRWIAFANNLNPNVPGFPVWERYGPGKGSVLRFGKRGSVGMMKDDNREKETSTIASNFRSFGF